MRGILKAYAVFGEGSTSPVAGSLKEYMELSGPAVIGNECTVMIRFSNALRDWKTDRFAETVKAELGRLTSGVLPLDRCVTRGGLVDERGRAAMVLGAYEDDRALHVSLGLFFTEIVINCGCGDDPLEEHAYCEIDLRIDKKTAEATFSARSA